MDRISLSIVWSVLQVTAFLLMAAPVHLLVRRVHPRVGTAAALGSLAAVILLSALAGSNWPRWNMGSGQWRALTTDADRSDLNSGVAKNASLERTSTNDLRAPAGQGAVGDKRETLGSVIGETWEAVIGIVANAPGAPSSADVAAEREGSAGEGRFAVVIVGLMAAGLLVGTVQLAGGLIAVRRLAARSRAIDDEELAEQVAALRAGLGLSDEVLVRESGEVSTPAVIGGVALTGLGQGHAEGKLRRGQSLILLPASWRSWNDDERESVLAHELAHVAQRDFTAWIIARIAIALHFYHPLVRWFARRLQLDQELAADGAAVRLLGDRDEYLRALASLALATPMHRMAGPARTFIPSRSMLLRRVEMLRTTKASKSSASITARSGRWASWAMLGSLALLVAGLRAPTLSKARAEEPRTAGAQAGEQPADEAGAAAASGEHQGYDFTYVPESMFVMALRPSAMAASPRLKLLAELIEENTRPKFPAVALEQVTLAVPVPADGPAVAGGPPPGSGEYTVFRTNRAVNFRPAIEAAYGDTVLTKHGNREIIALSNYQGSIDFYAANERTLISHPRERLVHRLELIDAAAQPPGAAEWIQAAGGRCSLR